MKVCVRDVWRMQTCPAAHTLTVWKRQETVGIQVETSNQVTIQTLSVSVPANHRYASSNVLHVKLRFPLNVISLFILHVHLRHLQLVTTARGRFQQWLGDRKPDITDRKFGLLQLVLFEVNKNTYFELNHHVFLTLTKWLLCPKPNQSMSTVVRVCTLVTGLKQGGEFSLLGIVSSVFMKLDFPGLGDNIHCIFACVDDDTHILLAVTCWCQIKHKQTVNHRGSVSVTQPWSPCRVFTLNAQKRHRKAPERTARIWRRTFEFAGYRMSAAACRHRSGPVSWFCVYSCLILF